MMNAIKNFFDVRRHPEEKRNEFYFNCFLGILSIIIFALIKNTTWGQETINSWFDKYISLSVEEEVASKITFLDFDNISMRELQRPILTPRDKISDLVKVAYEGGAKVIFIDFKFFESDYSPKSFLAGDEIAIDGQARDKILYDLLQKIRDDKLSDTKILLPISTYADLSETKNIFTDLIDDKKIFGVTPNFSINAEGDVNVRFWLPYLKIKSLNTDEEKLLWSLPILTLILTQGDISELRSLDKNILSDSTDNYAEYSLMVNRQGVEEKFIFSKERYKNGGVIRDTRSNQHNRIKYTLIPSPLYPTPLVGNIPPKQIAHWRENGIDNKRLDCKDKVVIIGRADDDCNDFHMTPVGNMPGMYVHGNSLQTILSDTQPRLSSALKNFIMEIILVVMVAYLFLNFSEGKAQIAALIFVLVYGLGTYIYYCQTNEFIDVSPAFASIEVYDIIKLTEIFVINFISNLRGRFRGIVSRLRS